MTFANYVSLSQLLISIVLIVVVLLQARGGDIGAAFGGGSTGSTFRTRRGLEKTLFQLTIILAIIFVGISALSVRYA
ncbi:MAG: preprotein translocase subunit SecG [Chloroflexi bacterium]|nr:preprotein translocase subunit SecG [Chloroflexota bacterium]